MTRTITLRTGEQARLPELPGLPLVGWQIDRSRKGYLRFTSRSKRAGVKRGARAHRVVMELLIGRPLLETEQVHHQDFSKLNNCGCNLILLDGSLNPSPSRRDPYTGAFISAGEWERRYA